MRDSASMAGEDIARLRRRIAQIEGRVAGFGEGGKNSDSGGLEEEACRRGPASPPSSPFRPRRSGTVLPLGIAPLDRLLAGGLRRNALHEIRGETTRDAAAATGFAAAILARLAADDDRPILWIVEAAAVREAGLPLWCRARPFRPRFEAPDRRPRPPAG